VEVFFLFFEKANYPCVRPVMKLLHSRGALRPVFVKGFDYKEHIGSIRPLEAQEPFETLDIADFFESPISEEAPEADRFPALVPRGTFESELACRLLRNEVARPRFRVAFEARQKVEAALRELVAARRPRLVVLPEDTDYARGRLAARALRRIGVPVVTLSAPFYNMFASYPLVGRRYCDRYMVGNQVMQERLVRAGVAERRVHVVGNPGFDELRAVRPGKRGAKAFLFAAQGLETDRQVLIDLVEVFSRHPSFDLIVKAHPEAGADLFDALPTDVRNIQAVHEPWTARQTLERADCVIAQTSTLLYQAMAVGLPVIVAHYRPGPLEISLPREVSDGAVANHRAELDGLVQMAAAERLPQAAAEWVQPPDFRASERAADLLEAICGGI